MSKNGVAAKKSCQKSKVRQEKDILGVTVATVLLNVVDTGSCKASQIAPTGIALPKQLGLPGLVNVHVPISG